MSLLRKQVIITGGGTGIGKGIASEFLAAGAAVTIAGRRMEKLTEAKNDLLSRHPDADLTLQECDVSNREQVVEMFAKINSKQCDIDILVNCAGTNIVDRTMAAMSPEDWDQVLAINATGAYNCMAQVLPAMRDRGDGLIVNVSSIAGKRALALGGIAYAASKFAMTALGTAVGNEVAGDGVRVTNVYPGEVNTPILEKRPKPVSDEQKSKMVQPEDIGKMVVAIATLPSRTHVPEIIIKPLVQEYV